MLLSFWIGAQVEIIERKVDQFKIFDTEDGFPAVSVRAGFTQDSMGFIWLASNMGLYRFDGYHVKSYNASAADSTSLHDNYVSRIFKNSKGQYLIGSAYQGIAEYLPKEDQFKHTWRPSFANEFGNIRKLIEDRSGNLYSASSRGLFKYEPQTGQYRQIKFTTENTTSSVPYKNHSSCYDLALDPHKEKIWIGGRFGLWVFDIETEKYEWFYNPLFYAAENSPQPRMTGISYDEKRNCVWVISRGNGVFQFFPKTKTWVNKMAKNRHKKETFYIADGVQDLGDEILLSAQARKGAMFYHKDNHQIENIIFQKEQKPKKFTFGCYASFIDRNGYLISIYESGVVRSSIPIRPVDKIDPPKLAITEIEWKRKKLDSINPIFLDQLKIDKAPEILKINFAAINPPNPAHTLYKYRLNGHDKDWIEQPVNLQALYSNLKPGHYEFEVMAQDTLLQWSTQKSLLSLEVYQPFWKRTWVKVFGVACLLGLLFYWIQKSIKEKQAQQLKESNFEKQLAEVQMQALRSQMNPHFLFNSLNSIKHYVINKDKRDAANYLTKFSKLMRNILQNSNHSLVSLEKEIELIRLYMEIERMRFENPFEITVEVEEHLNISSTLIPPMLLQPYVENAIWHGLRYKEKEGRIWLKVLESENGFLCIIEDNGIGRAEAEQIKNKNTIQKKSMGTQITKNRIELINKLYGQSAVEETIDLFDNHGKALGTRVVLKIPFFNIKNQHGA